MTTLFDRTPLFSDRKEYCSYEIVVTQAGFGRLRWRFKILFWFHSPPPVGVTRDSRSVPVYTSFCFQMQTIRLRLEMQLKVGSCYISQQAHGLDSHSCKKIALSLVSRVLLQPIRIIFNHKLLSKSNSTRLWLTREQQMDLCARAAAWEGEGGGGLTIHSLITKICELGACFLMC